MIFYSKSFRLKAQEHFKYMISPGPNLYSLSTPFSSNSRNLILLKALNWELLLLAGYEFILVTYEICCILYRINECPDFLCLQYGVVIDAGSSHSQIFIYKWDGRKENGTAIARQIYTCKVKGRFICYHL